MDRVDTRTKKSTRTLRNPRIGFIGKATITEEEAVSLNFIGRCIARLGHILVTTGSKGAATQLKEGVEFEKGSIELLTSGGVIERANHTLIYPSPQLLQNLKTKYPDIETRTDVVIIEQDQLSEWVEAVVTICMDKQVPLPD